MKKYHVFLTILISIFLIPSLGYSKRGISVIEDLSHKSGKLGAYKALVIGINDYQDPKIPDLKSTVNDAKAMANLLSRKYGFSVDLMLNGQATRAKVIQKLRKLALDSRPDDSILFYYAGHGDIDRVLNDGWWIPVDATGGDPSTYLDNTIVQKVLRSMKSKHILLISDSCYSGTLFGQVRSIPSVIDDKYYPKPI
ncbi:MAG: caspase family protein [Deltaproteobacteria bacterium]|nr:caspase family protein [Deltaproteobacteria bacterium]